MEVLEKIEKLRKERGWSINNLAMEALLTQIHPEQSLRAESGA